jgi:hypothetical protein
MARAVEPFIVAPEDYADSLDIVGEHVTVLASGERTQGYEIFLQRGPEGSGPQTDEQARQLRARGIEPTQKFFPCSPRRRN